MVPLLRPDVQTFVDPRGLIVYDPHTGLRVLLGPESTLLWEVLSEGTGSASALINSTPELIKLCYWYHQDGEDKNTFFMLVQRLLIPLYMYTLA